jgi:RimJ/RimL family protein N-acetyltransferase
MSSDPEPSIWCGRLVRLRAFEADDWEDYYAWNSDDEQARNLQHIPFPQTPDAVRHWAEREAARTPEGDNFRFVIEDAAGQVAGDLTVHDCDRRVGTFSYGISIRRGLRQRGYAADAIGVVLRYYFEELRYQKVTVMVLDINPASVRLHEALGFQQEGRLRRVAFTGGDYHDMLVYGLTVDEWRESSIGRSKE